MISTRSPMAASAVPRLIAVVVLPTPPFWLASTRMRGRTAGSASAARMRSAGRRSWAGLHTAARPKYRRFGVDLAREDFDRQIRRGRKRLELRLGRSSARKNPDRAVHDPHFGQFESQRQGGESARDDGVHRSAGSRARSLRPARRESRPARRSRAPPRAGRRICAGRFRCRWTRAPATSASWIAITRPGKPAPEPISTQRLASGASGRSWAESAMWRVQTSAKLAAEMRLVAVRQRASRST